MRLSRSVVLLGLAASLMWAAAPPQSLAEVEREPDLEKRAGLALDYARAAVGRVVKAYAAGEPGQAKQILDSIVQAAEVARESLGDTGKHARSKPKHFKKAEIESRKLVRDLEAAKRDLTFEERPDLDPAIAQIEEINRQLLFDIMESKRK
jgi:hypothetical protein